MDHSNSAAKAPDIEAPKSSRMRFAAILWLLAAGALGCAATRAPLTCPDKGGPRWTELISAHFILETDIDLPTARATLTDLERSHDALAYVTRPKAHDGHGRVEVVLFERENDFFEFAGQERTKSAYYTSQLEADVEPRPIFVMHDSDLAEDTREVFQHELGHRFLHERFGALPPWLNEGLAQYYSTLRIEAGRVVVGGALASLDFSDRPNFWLAWHGNSEQLEVPIIKAPTVRQLTEADRATFYLSGKAESISEADRERQTAFYAGAWKLVQMLMNGPDDSARAHFQAFLGDMDRGERARDAFLERLGADWPGLEQAFHAYLGKTRLARFVVEYHPPEPPLPRERTLSDAEVHLLWARLLPWKEGSLDRTEREIDEARAKAPSSPEVRYMHAMFLLREHELAFDDALAELDAALAARPSDARYLLAALEVHRQRAAILRHGDAAPRELVQRLAQAATTATELAEVAVEYGRAGQLDAALAFVDKALELDPIAAPSHAVRAELLFAMGRLDEALAASEHAITLLPERASATALMELRDKIERARRAASP